MKKFLINFCFFILGTIPIYVLLIICSGQFLPAFYTKNLFYKHGGNTGVRLNDIKKHKQVDILFLGSSHAYRGYDVRIFKKMGFTAFNLGSSAQTPTQTEYLLRKYLPVLKPKYVVFDIFPVMFNSDGIESTVDLVSNGELDASLFKFVFGLNNITLYNTAIYSSFMSLTGKKKEIIRSNTEEIGGRYISGGFVESFKTSVLKQNYEPSEFNISKDQLEAFKRILSLLKENKVNYILVQAPLYNKRYKSIRNTEYVDSLFSSYGTYYNFNKIITLPEKAFIDNSHLNQVGVNIFNVKLIDMMNKMNFFEKKAVSGISGKISRAVK